MSKGQANTQGDAYDQTVLLQIERICDQFERQLRIGHPVEIEKLLLDAPLQARAKLFQDLVVLEWEYQPPSSPQSVSVDLKERFPDYAHLVDNIITRFQATQTTVDNQHTATPRQTTHAASDHSKTTIIGPYQLLEPLGEGGMGQVFKAYHPIMDRYVAIKLIRPDQVGNTDAIARFRREIQAAAKLEHPNIIRAYDAGQVQNDGPFYLAMELAEGSDLARVLKKEKTLAVQRACNYIRQAALGLSHAHQCGFIHRDVKPANLFLTNGGVVKVLDLGLARLISGVEVELSAKRNDMTTSLLTQSGVIMGTPDYMSPEQAYDSQLTNELSDIYSLGCTFYHLLTGRTPFEAQRSLHRKIHAHQNYQPNHPLERLCSDLPAGLSVIVNTMMAKRPENRFSTMKSVAEAVTPYCSGLVHPSHLTAFNRSSHLDSDVDVWEPPEMKSESRPEPPLPQAPPVVEEMPSAIKKKSTWIPRYSLAKQIQESEQLADAFQAENIAKRIATLELLLKQHVDRNHILGAYDTALELIKLQPQHPEAIDVCKYLRRKIRIELLFRAIGNSIYTSIMALTMALVMALPALGASWLAFWIEEQWTGWWIQTVVIGLKLISGMWLFGMSFTGFGSMLHTRWFRHLGKSMVYFRETFTIIGLFGGAALMCIVNWTTALSLILVGFLLILFAHFLSPDGLPFKTDSLQKGN